MGDSSVPDLGATYLDHVGLSVRDLQSLSAWYMDALDLVVEAAFEYRLGRREVHGVLLASRDGWRLEMQQCQGSAPAQAQTPAGALLQQGQGHFCLRVGDIDEAFAGLVAHGAAVGIEPIDSPIAGVRISYLVDPEGNLIELLEQRDVPSD